MRLRVPADEEGDLHPVVADDAGDRFGGRVDLFDFEAAPCVCCGWVNGSLMNE